MPTLALAATFVRRLDILEAAHQTLLSRRAEPIEGNGIFERHRDAVLTAAHTPLAWRYDLDAERNPFLLERMAINAVFNPGAIMIEDRFLLVVRVEGADRKSFFAVAESENGVDGWKFWNEPVSMPETEEPDVNVYDMRLTDHEDGWIYGVFCTERKDKTAPHDPSAIR